MLRCGVTGAGFPIGHRPAGNMKLLGQGGLRQAKLRAQRQDSLAKGIVALTREGPVHVYLVSYIIPKILSNAFEAKNVPRWKGSVTETSPTSMPRDSSPANHIKTKLAATLLVWFFHYMTLIIVSRTLRSNQTHLVDVVDGFFVLNPIRR